jgi:uncharacterized membrane protein YphA (DoxX/SURF4 family)
MGNKTGGISERFSRYSPLVLRTGIAFVFLWFGFSQIKSPSQWTGFLPQFTNSLPLSQISLIYLNASFEIVLAFFLIAGLYTRLSSILLGLHLLSISYSLGYGPVAIRDFGLAISAFVVFLHGPDDFCIDSLNAGRHENNPEKQ